ncbi:Undecaprenyl-phosphate galactose phosphotransferase, WbaP/exopolysaccharide biosynthesis polyprenyl glycosylphosphotransferase [Raineyella antarctica]|uniref:Undecaprenyl-phosphate galactose phosphotransferase, WbaP/exopolysaccharide biosynthesis polyprenyl glycosylphosphotransferase n=1 Tax=Raineyella antarctica TaxID=1577474 RepID=A0A1G6GCY9_9ACTN|nr:sugar transferase [Raineyella antarctica]SDB79858.1 Undecaprenyl-phosphate galactose phosphotransferase, WbaP/exopolysaccharide biosynthesis polyprenyl glycosylphosphotransferase [Raineyella antarctica]
MDPFGRLTAEETIQRVPAALLAWDKRRRGSNSVVRTAVIVTDLLMILLSTLVAVVGRNSLNVFDEAADVSSVVTGMALWLVPLWIAVFASWGLYRVKNMGAGSLEYQSVVTASGITAGTSAAILYLTKNDVSRGFFVLEFSLGVVLLLLGRLTVRRLVQRARAHGLLLNRVVLSGDVQHIEEIATVIKREVWLGYRIVGAVIPPATGQPYTPSGIPVIGHTDELGTAVKAADAEAVICTEGSFSRSRDFRRLAWDLENENTQMIVVPTMTDVSAERLRVRPIAGLPLVHVEQPQSEAASRWGKKLFDLVGSTLLIVLASPIMLAVALAIKIDDGGPIFFRQVRVGKDGNLIRVYKFRSMVIDAEKLLADLQAQNENDGVLFKMARDPRITRVGHFIRRYSLDETPQFFNVFRGDMSLVGPRPALPSEVEQYEDHVRRRLDVRPGITGLWQVSGRSDLPWEETVRLDLYYVDNWSMVQDFTILLKTFRAVVASAGAY